MFWSLEPYELWTGNEVALIIELANEQSIVAGCA